MKETNFNTRNKEHKMFYKGETLFIKCLINNGEYRYDLSINFCKCCGRELK